MRQILIGNIYQGGSLIEADSPTGVQYIEVAPILPSFWLQRREDSGSFSAALLDCYTDRGISAKNRRGGKVSGESDSLSRNDPISLSIASYESTPDFVAITAGYMHRSFSAIHKLTTIQSIHLQLRPCKTINYRTHYVIRGWIS